MILHPFDAIADHRVDIGSRLATDIRLDEAIALRRCAMYRKAFRGESSGQVHDLHYRADGADLTGVAEIIVAMIAEMAGITRKSGGVLSRLSVGDVDLTDGEVDPRRLRRVAQTINEVTEDACIRFRYPRPALTVSPSPITLLPAA
jgi:hypothetical protein